MARRPRFLFSKKRATSTTDLKTPKQWLIDVLGGSTSSGQSVNEETATKFAGLRAAVDLRSILLASMPVMTFEKIPEGRNELPEDPVTLLLARQPNPWMNAYNFWELLNNHLDLWGNAYAVITWRGSNPVALSPVHPSAVEPLVNSKGLIYKITDFEKKGLKPEYLPKDILHFKGFSTDGIKGKSPIREAAEAIGLGLAAEEFAASFFNNKGHSKGVIEMDGNLDDESFDAFKKSWDKNKDHGTPLLEYGMKYKELSISHEDAQLISTRQFQIQDISRIYHIPPHLLGELSRSTFSNVEHSDIQFVKYGLRPMVKRYERELEVKLFPNNLSKYVRFNLDGILRGDTATRTGYYSQAIQNRWMSPNEVRALENMNPRDGGDVYENPNTTSNGSTTEN
jgi:HK97 family phage portal protein